MRIEVDRSLCEANAVCEAVVPEVFQVTEADELIIREPEPPDALRARVEEAIRRCPRRALSLVG